MLRRIIFTAALSGLLGGLLLSAIQTVRIYPIIHEAETYETAASPGKTHEPVETAYGGMVRVALSAIANVVAAIGFALLLTAAISLHGGANFRRGLLWGIGGYAAFSLAPALGLPPEIPGTYAAPVPARQIWWVMTVALTAGGLALAAFARDWKWKALGAVLITLPPLIGAPRPANPGGLAPEALGHQFALAALAASGIFWLALGGLSGYFFTRLEEV